MVNKKKPFFSVTWQIDVCADSPREAAEQARRIQLDESSIATVFKVIEYDRDGEEFHIDLLEPEEKKKDA